MRRSASALATSARGAPKIVGNGVGIHYATTEIRPAVRDLGFFLITISTS